MFERFRRVGLFADLTEDDLSRICTLAGDVDLEPGQVLFREGDWADRAFVVTSGEVEVPKATDRREVLLAVRGEADVIGEMALLEHAPRSATVRARTSTHLISIPTAALDDLLATSPTAARGVFLPLLRRVRETNDQLRHSERMVQLGVLTAGVVHELNNPAAAIRAAAHQLVQDLDRLIASLAGQAAPAVLALLAGIADRAIADLSPIQVSDVEAAVEDQLDRAGIDETWVLAPALVEAGITADELAALGPDVDLAGAARFLAPAVAVRRAADEIADSARRMSDIVGALRSYSYLDQAPMQAVDVVAGIEDTLTLLSHVTAGVRVVRDLPADLPRIEALGGELNQVWTNLIQNACDALAGVPSPILTVRAHRDGDGVTVEIEDNGPGIPPELQTLVFDAFFTTKAPGQGTGLGLQISHRIVVLEHHGELTLSSRPGRTVFAVRLPPEPPRPSQAIGTHAGVGDDPSASRLCAHLRDLVLGPVPAGGCLACAAVGDRWVHLRFCVSCGNVGCCDDSPNRHATRHALEEGHPVMRSKEPGEDWAWCVVDQVGTPHIG